MQSGLPNVLVVNADHRMQYLLNAALHSSFQSSRCRTMQRALKVHREAPHDLIILNSELLNPAAQAHLRTLRSNDHDTPIALLTPDSDSGRIGACVELGITNYLKIPCAPESLRRSISSILEKTCLKDPGVDVEAMHEKYGALFAVLADRIGSKQVAQCYLEEHYDGAWKSLTDWSQKFAADEGMLDSMPFRMLRYFNFGQMAQDMLASGEVYLLKMGTCLHVFSRLNDRKELSDASAPEPEDTPQESEER